MRVLVTAALVLAVCATTSGLALAGDGSAPRHVRAISGSRDYGFHLRWSDGRQAWTPTLSEVLAECTEYDRAARRARCAAASRTRYRWMGILKRSLRHHDR